MGPVTASLRNAVAKALIADRDMNAMPNSRRAWQQRQTFLTQAVAKSLGVEFARVKPVVVEAWLKVYGVAGMVYSGGKVDYANEERELGRGEAGL